LETCGRLAIGPFMNSEIVYGPIANRPQDAILDAILPHIDQ